MSARTLEELALRKEVLRARSALYRLKLQHELHTIGNSFQWTKAGAKVMTSLPMRSALLGLIFKFLPDSKVSRLLTLMSQAALFTKMTRIIVDVFKSRFPS
ncbi:MAG: hypothetical protein V4568_09980 [Pseudomonadota bacterium]